MTMLDLSKEYHCHAQALQRRIEELEACVPSLDMDQQAGMMQRIHMLHTMWREARDLAVLMERYYDRGYRRNVGYKI